jgi:hypothetical protein
MSNYCERQGHAAPRGVKPGDEFTCMNCGAGCVAAPPAEANSEELVKRGGPPVIESAPVIGLPTEDAARKSLPVFGGLLMYFPLACCAVADVSRRGNEQHNPGEPLHWARGKSMNQLDTATRHLMDHGIGIRYDKDGGRHLAKAAWRVLAELQLDIEREAAEHEASNVSSDA